MNPLPGVNAFPTATSNFAIGQIIGLIAKATGAVIRDIRSDFCLPRVSGATPKTIKPTKETTIIAKTKAEFRFIFDSINTKVNNTPPADVSANATSCKTATCFAFSEITFCSFSIPLTSSLRNCSTLDSDVFKIAVLPAIKNAARISTMAASKIKIGKLIIFFWISSRNS